MLAAAEDSNIKKGAGIAFMSLKVYIYLDSKFLVPIVSFDEPV